MEQTTLWPTPSESQLVQSLAKINTDDDRHPEDDLDKQKGSNLSSLFHAVKRLHQTPLPKCRDIKIVKMTKAWQYYTFIP